MKVVTLFEYSTPEEKDAKEILKKIENELKRVNRKAKIFERTWDDVKATSYVGVLSIKDVTIQILPKLYKGDEGARDKKEDKEKRIEEATRNLLFMLSYTRRLKIKETGISRLKREKYNLYEVIVYLFAKNLMETLKRNYRREYERREERLKYVKSRILLNRQIRQPTHEKIYCSYHELTEDNLLNRVLKYTCYLLSKRVKNHENWLLLQNILNILDGVELSAVQLSDIDRIKINRLNEDYTPFLGLCKLFLENMSLELQSSQFRTFSLVFDMNVLFEEFIGELLRRYRSEILRGNLKDCIVNLQRGDRWLMEKPKAFKLVPDIMIKKGNKVELIIDTKYKILDPKKKYYGISQADIYQMFAYGKKYGCNRIVLLYPWTPELGKKGVLETYSFEKEFNLHVATINLRRNLRDGKEMENLREELSKIISACSMEYS